MNIYDQLKQLWARVTGLEKDGAAAGTKIGALEAAAVRIPKDYSTTETATGLKWIDDEDIYSITVYDDLPEITQSTNITLATITTGLNVINMEAMLYTSAGVAYNPPVNYYYSPISGTVLFLGVSTSFSNGKGKATLYYTKPTATRDDDTNDEPETKKATKKKTTK